MNRHNVFSTLSMSNLLNGILEERNKHGICMGRHSQGTYRDRGLVLSREMQKKVATALEWVSAVLIAMIANTYLCIFSYKLVSDTKRYYLKICLTIHSPFHPRLSEIMIRAMLGKTAADSAASLAVFWRAFVSTTLRS